MIKINLLESVTDRPKGLALVEDKVSSSRIQTLLMALTVLGLLLLSVSYEYASSNSAHGIAFNLPVRTFQRLCLKGENKLKNRFHSALRRSPLSITSSVKGTPFTSCFG